MDLTSQENFLHASGIHDSVDLLTSLTKCIVDLSRVIFLLYFFFPYSSSRLLGYRAPTLLLLLRCGEAARRSWRSSGEGLGAACDHGSAEARRLRLEVLLGSRDGFMQNCAGEVYRFRPHILEFLQPQVSFHPAPARHLPRDGGGGAGAAAAGSHSDGVGVAASGGCGGFQAGPAAGSGPLRGGWSVSRRSCPLRRLPLAGGSWEGGGAAAGWDGAVGPGSGRRHWAATCGPGVGSALAEPPPPRGGSSGGGRRGWAALGFQEGVILFNFSVCRCKLIPLTPAKLTSAYNRAKFGCGVDGIKAHVSE